MMGHNVSMRIILSVIYLLLLTGSSDVFGAKKRELSKMQLDPFYDMNADYALFSGRISDRDKTSNVLKVSSENANIKFFKVGDPVSFNIARYPDKRHCEGTIRDVEKGYVVIFVKNLMPCWDRSAYLRRGTILNFFTEVLADRVVDASLYRMVLLKRREDYFKQMNGINHFIWSFDQQKVLLASEFDKKILELQKQKQKAIDELLGKKKYNAHLQKELAYRLDVLERDLDFYRINKSDSEGNRWQLDHDLGKPVDTRPQEIKVID
jgi:hypothetical protein